MDLYHIAWYVLFVNTLSFGGATLFIQRQNTMFSRCLCLPDGAAPSETQKELSANISRWYLTLCQIFKCAPKTFLCKGWICPENVG